MGTLGLALFAGNVWAKKDRIDIESCVCDEQEDSTYICSVGFDGAAPAELIDYHAHVTVEQEGVLDADGETPATCKARTECQSIAADDEYVATCSGVVAPDSECTALLAEGFDSGIVAKVAADADEGTHGNATRVLKDNFPGCTVNPYEAPL